MAATRKPNELYLTRVFDAPVHLVWHAWVDEDQVGQWWGPRGFTLTTHSKDVRVGGTWVYTMHGPDGKDYPNITTYLEVEAYSKLVYDHGATATTPPMFRVTVHFTEQGGKTRMDMTMALATAEAAQATKAFIKKAGGESTWDRLAEYVHERNGADRFVINRTFDAPIERVFEMWTDPANLANWMGPTGSTTRFFRGNITTGGSTFWCMDSAHGVMYGQAKYLEVTRPTRLVYTQNFCDEQQNVIRHPMAPTWPEKMLTTVEFTAEDEGRTRITLTWEVYGDATPEERATFHQAKGGMTMGWTGSFDKLEEALAHP